MGPTGFATQLKVFLNGTVGPLIRHGTPFVME
jgi:hypothetical protein